jgi:Na+/H+-dicarboxylate symporter
MLQRYWFDVVLWKRILGALVIGALVGLALGETATSIKWIGDLFVRLIQMIAVPIVFLSVTTGVAAMGDSRRLGTIGAKVMLLYIATTLVAVMLGFSMGALFQPGAGVDFAGIAPKPLAEAPSMTEQLLRIVPLNPFEALAKGDLLAVIFFAFLLGAAILKLGERAEPVRRVFDSSVEMLLFVTSIVMEVAPFGAFALVAWVTGTQGLDVFEHIFLLAAALLLGCLIQIFVVHAGMLRLLARLPVLPFFRHITDVVLVAFSTGSSAATLPVSLRVAKENLGVSHAVASICLPLGVSASKDGTAIFLALLTMFAVQAFRLDLSVAQFALAALTITLVSVGTAPVPSASLFMLAAVLNSIGVSPEQTALVVGFVLPFDRPLDMTRGVPNNTIDLAVAVTIAVWEGELDTDAYLS